MSITLQTPAPVAPVAVGPEHTHVHQWEGGDRQFSHSHPWPTDAEGLDATYPHRHVNGRHSHPHGHEAYA